MPNPWDVGSARVLEALGFPALATTSSGFAFTLGRLDGSVTLDEMVGHARLLADATGVPLSLDLENGYGHDPADAARAITAAAEAGAVGGSIEDYDRVGKIYELGHAAERVAAAREAADAVGFPFTLTARTENLLHGERDLDDVIARLQAYERAGADVVFAPGLRSVEQIRAVHAEISKPLNVLAPPKLSVRDIIEAGAKRISVGGSLSRLAVGAMAAAASRIRNEGDFSALGGRVPIEEWLGG